ncbi:MAG: YHS domain-containing protein [Clostridiaceae bacterium]|nr:YHS domain-containing protein [Clostridiaceae bacterium]
MDYIVGNWWYLLLIGWFGFMMFRGGGCCGGRHSHGGHSRGGHAHTGHNGGSNQIDMAHDPECGMYVNPDTAIKQSIDGTTYYFCSENCRSSFVRKHQGY